MNGSDNRYLLRLWCDGGKGDAWRASLKDLTSETSWYFSSIEQLLTHLRDLSGVGIDMDRHE